MVGNHNEKKIIDQHLFILMLFVQTVMLLWNNMIRDVATCRFFIAFWYFLPTSYKFGMILHTLTFRCFSGCSNWTNFHNELTFLQDIFWKNVYSMSLIDKCFKTLYVLVMSCTCFRVNLHSIVAWMSRNSLLEAGAKSEV